MARRCHGQGALGVWTDRARRCPAAMAHRPIPRSSAVPGSGIAANAPSATTRWAAAVGWTLAWIIAFTVLAVVGSFTEEMIS